MRGVEFHHGLRAAIQRSISQIVEGVARLKSQGTGVQLVALNADQKETASMTIHQARTLGLIRQRTRTLGRLLLGLFV